MKSRHLKSPAIHSPGGLRAVIFDWAGTTIDFGSRAPAAVFLEIFRREGVEITVAEARGPMGRAKREHIAAILSQPRVAETWRQFHGGNSTEADVDRLYAEFLPLQLETVAQHADVIPGVPEIVAECRRRGLAIGSTTGYPRPLMDVIQPLASSNGFSPDVVICADDVPQGRPAPWMLFRAAERLNAFPPLAIVVVDDTTVGIQAGQNAGAWTVAVTRTGNSIGLSPGEVAALPAADLRRRVATAAQEFHDLGADFVIESAADLAPVLDEIASRLDRRNLEANPTSISR